MMQPRYSHEGVNPSCGDDIILNLNVDENGIITDGSFEGSGCAISQASADMMFDLIIGKSVEEAKELSGIFSRMIKETISDEELEKNDIRQSTIRLSVGTENIDDIIADLESGFAALK